MRRLDELPQEIKNVLFSLLRISDLRTTPAGAVLIGMQLLSLLGVPRIIDDVLGEEHTSLEQLKGDYNRGCKTVPSPGIVLAMLVADMLAYPKHIARLYKVEELAEEWYTGPLMGICPKLLNDDRIGRCLSKLGSTLDIMEDILTLLTVNVAERFSIPLSRFFIDNTVLQLDGEFAKALKVTTGRGRDSLSQLLVSLTIAAGSRIPVAFGVLPGRTNDAQTLAEPISKIDHLAAPGATVELCVDRGYLSGDNVYFLLNQPRKYLFTIPLTTDKAGKSFCDLVDQAWDSSLWQQIDYVSAQEAKYKRKNSYTCFETTWTLTSTEKPPLEEGQKRRPKGSIIHHTMELRCVIYRSDNNAKAECGVRECKVAKCNEALIDIQGKLNKRNLVTIDAVKAKINEIVKKFRVNKFIRIDIAANEHEAVVLSWTWDNDALFREKRYDGIFAFLTNHSVHKVDAKALVRKYRDRNQSEMNFADLKGLLDLERVLVHLPERIDSYIFIKVLAYFILAFLRFYAESNGQKKITETKIQDAFSRLAIGKVTIEPLDIPRWSLANDNKLATWLRDSLSLPDPAPYVDKLNDLVDVNKMIDHWLGQWSLTRKPNVS